MFVDSFRIGQKIILIIPAGWWRYAKWVEDKNQLSTKSIYFLPKNRSTLSSIESWLQIILFNTYPSCSLFVATIIWCIFKCKWKFYAILYWLQFKSINLCLPRNVKRKKLGSRSIRWHFGFCEHFVLRVCTLHIFGIFFFYFYYLKHWFIQIF